MASSAPTWEHPASPYSLISSLEPSPHSPGKILSTAAQLPPLVYYDFRPFLKDLLSITARLNDSGFFSPYSVVWVSSYLSLLQTPSRSVKGYRLLTCSFQNCSPCQSLRSVDLDFLSDSVGLCSGIMEVIRWERCIPPTLSPLWLTGRQPCCRSPFLIKAGPSQPLEIPICHYILGQLFSPSHFSVFPSCHCGADRFSMRKRAAGESAKSCTLTQPWFILDSCAGKRRQARNCS